MDGEIEFEEGGRHRRPRRPQTPSRARRGGLRSVIAQQGKRMNLQEYSAVAGAAVNQFIESFDAPQDPYARAALRFSPFLLMSPQPRGRGFEGFVKDPRVVGAALVAGIVVAGVNRNEARSARDIKITAPTFVFRGQPARLLADVVDARGVSLPNEAVSWTSSDPTLAAIDAHSGVLTTSVPAFPDITFPRPVVLLTATSGDIVRRHHLTIRAPLIP
jgi:hypothetical protein